MADDFSSFYESAQKKGGDDFSSFYETAKKSEVKPAPEEPTGLGAQKRYRETLKQAFQEIPTETAKIGRAHV